MGKGVGGEWSFLSIINYNFLRNLKLFFKEFKISNVWIYKREISFFFFLYKRVKRVILTKNLKRELLNICLRECKIIYWLYYKVLILDIDIIYLEIVD